MYYILYIYIICASNNAKNDSYSLRDNEIGAILCGACRHEVVLSDTRMVSKPTGPSAACIITKAELWREDKTVCIGFYGRQIVSVFPVNH